MHVGVLAAGDAGSSDGGDGGSSHRGDAGSSDGGDGGSSDRGDAGSSDGGDGGSSDAGGATGPNSGDALFRRAIALREAIHAVFEALANQRPLPDAALEVLSGEWAEARAHQTIAQDDAGGFRIRTEADSALLKTLRVVGSAAGDLLLEVDPARLKVCAAEDCGYLYLDASKNRSRRWCDMADCGNRDKVRRFRARGGGSS